MNKKKVVIVGGGFGGIAAAKLLGRYPNEVDVHLIDRRNHHLFQPLLYQVATAALSPAEIAAPIRSILAGARNTHVMLGNVHSVEPAARSLTTDFGTVNYDYLILACGAKHSYFGHDEWEAYAPGLKTLEQATEIRRRVLLAFELAEREKDVETQKQLQTFVIVGGGPTGVELAGAVAEISRYTLIKDFQNIDPARTRIILIESASRILNSFSPELASQATKDLERLGVHVWTNSRVTEISDSGVSIGKEFVKAATVIWGAGVAPSSVNQSLGVELDKQGRVKVGADLSVPSYPELFVIGDQAHCEDSKGQALPGLAPVAIQQGRHVARSIIAEVRGKARQAYVYYDKGQMATIGRNKAIAETKSLRLTGFIAWLAWLFVHIYYLIGFRNKIFVLYDWAWSYMTYKRTARLILSKEWQSHVLTQIPAVASHDADKTKNRA